MLRLSIIVNMYNTAKYLPKCIDTLTNQDIPTDDYEIILVDDCSTDNSVELANAFIEQYSNIRLYIHEHNKGLAGARNTGLDAAHGKYVCFVDPDDYIDKNSFSEPLDIMDEENLDMLRFNYQKVDENYNFLPDNENEASFDYSRGVITGQEFLGNRLGITCYVWPFIFNLNFVKTSGHRFIEGIYLDDTPWLPSILQSAHRIDCIDVRRHYYLQRGDSMVRKKTSQVINNKKDGLLKLLNVLIEQRNATQDKNVIKWYNGMISHCGAVLLGLSIDNDYRHVNDTISLLKKMSVFPLSTYNANKKAKRKFFLINLSPRLFCFIMKLKLNITKG